jgi:hypothetical protein
MNARHNPMRGCNFAMPDSLRDEIKQATKIMGAPSFAAAVRALIVRGLDQLENEPRPKRRQRK